MVLLREVFEKTVELEEYAISGERLKVDFVCHLIYQTMKFVENEIVMYEMNGVKEETLKKVEHTDKANRKQTTNIKLRK